MSSPTASPATEASSTLYFGPWYRRSPFFEKTLAAGCSAYDIYNHMYLPGYYADPIEEYWALLNDVTVWDVSVERIVEITGPDASAFTNMLTCRDLTKCAVGQGKYVLITAEDGGIVNDPVLLRVEENRWWLALADSDAGLWARGVATHAGMDVKVREPEVYPVQVQGPKSKDVMRTPVRRRGPRHQVLLDDDHRARRHPGRHQPDRLDRRGRLRDLPARPVARCRPVGPDHGRRQAPQDPADRAMRGAPDRGRHLQLRLGHDHRQQPVRGHRASSAWSSRRRPTTSARRRSRRSGPKGVSRKLVGIEFAGDALPFELSRKCDALHDGEPVGTVTDLIWSPRLEKNIGYVWLPIALAAPGTPLEIVAPDGGLWPATSAAIPFLDPRKDVPKS